MKKNPTLARIQDVVNAMSEGEFHNVRKHLGMIEANRTAVASTLFIRGLVNAGSLVDAHELKDRHVGVCG